MRTSSRVLTRTRGVGEFGGAAGGGADVVEVELEQPRLLVRGGQPDGQRVERVVAGRRRSTTSQ